jgi:hypothetical protein
METKTKTKQFVVNVSEKQKETLQSLKEEFNLSDKSVIELLLEVATNGRQGVTADDDGNPVEVDTFAVVVKGLGLAKPEKVVKEKVEKVELTPEQKAQRKLERQLANLQKKLAEAAAPSVETTEADEPETLVVSGV